MVCLESRTYLQDRGIYIRVCLEYRTYLQDRGIDIRVCLEYRTYLQDRKIDIRVCLEYSTYITVSIGRKRRQLCFLFSDKNIPKWKNGWMVGGGQVRHKVLYLHNRFYHPGFVLIYIYTEYCSIYPAYIIYTYLYLCFIYSKKAQSEATPSSTVRGVGG